MTFQTIIRFSNSLEEYLPSLTRDTKICSLLIAGTMAYAPTTNLASQSDIDLLAIVSTNHQLQELFGSLSGINIETDQIMNSLDGIETVVANADLKISVHAFTQSAFEKICFLSSSILTILRNPTSANFQPIWNCPAITQEQNNYLTVELDTEPYYEGLLCRYPVIIFKDDQKYCGPHIQQLMTYYVPITDENGYAAGYMNELHKAITKASIYYPNGHSNESEFSEYMSRHDPWTKNIMRLRTKWFHLTKDHLNA